MNSLTAPNGIFSCHSRIVLPRPQSKSIFSLPASTNVLGPNRSGRGFGVDVPSSVTLDLYRKCSGRITFRNRRDRRAGAVSIEPLAVSRWGGAPSALSYGFSIPGFKSRPLKANLLAAEAGADICGWTVRRVVGCMAGRSSRRRSEAVSDVRAHVERARRTACRQEAAMK